MASAREWAEVGFLLLIAASGVLAAAAFDQIVVGPMRERAEAACPSDFTRTGGICVRTAGLGCSISFQGGPNTGTRTCATNVKSGNGTLEITAQGAGSLRVVVTDAEGGSAFDRSYQLPASARVEVEGTAGRWGLRVDLQTASGDGSVQLRDARP